MRVFKRLLIGACLGKFEPGSYAWIMRGGKDLVAEDAMLGRSFIQDGL